MSQFTVSVSKDLKDLIPAFLGNRLQELAALRAALEGGDIEKLRWLAHRMKGVGGTYGFSEITLTGKRILDCTNANEHAEVGKLVAEYSTYLANVEVAYQ